MPKNNKIKTAVPNLGSSFTARARCKYCHGTPGLVFLTRGPHLHLDVNKAKNYFEAGKKYLKQVLNGEFYYLPDLRYANKLRMFNHRVYYKGYNPNHHRRIQKEQILVGYMVCSCGGTFWAFPETEQPEVTHKASRYKAPKDLLKGYF